MIFLILASHFVQVSGEDLYKFKKDTLWVYDATEQGKTGKIELKVIKEADGKVHVESKDFRPGEKEPRIENLTWYVEDGVLTWGEIKDGREKAVFNIYKLGSKKGDTWKSVSPGEGGEVVATHVGTEEIKVPAGTYKDTIHVRLIMKMGEREDEKVTADAYLAPKIGLIKMDVQIPGREKSVMELKEFKEGK